MKKRRIGFLGLLCAFSFFCAFFALGANEACAHEYVTNVWLAEPTCTEPGRAQQTCWKCYVTREAEISPLGHDFSPEFTVDKPATCGVQGQKSRHCTRCGEKTSITSITALNHEFTYSTVSPTCTEYGYRLRKCSNCGKEVKDQLVDPLGHKRGQWVVDRAATCTATGVRSVSCTVCGAVLEQKPIPATEHLYTERTVAPTCTAAGYTLRTCSVCGQQSKTNSVKALGHSFSENGVQTKAPSCTEKGEETVKCERCGLEKTQTVAALGHSYSGEWTIDTPPTCTAQGEQSRHCTRCGKRADVTTLPRAEHTAVPDADAAPTCTAAGKTGGTHCAVCGKQLTAATTAAALGHAFRQSAVLTEATCTEKGSVQRTCERCGKTETAATPALGHSYGGEWTVDTPPTCTAQGEKSRHCIRCGKRTDVTAMERTAHFDVTDPVVQPTCTEKGKTAGAHCKVCGKVLIEQKEIPATGHDFQTIASLAAATCTEKGRALVACKTCGATEEQEVPALGHSYSGEWTVDVPPTCTAQGEQSHRCVRCGKHTDVTTLPRAEHTVAYEGVVEPTCTKAGRADRAFCSVCGKELAEKTTIPARGHTPETDVTPATLKADGHTQTVCTVCGETLKTAAIPRVASIALSAKKFAFDGKKHLPSVTVKDSAGKTLKEQDCYAVKYASGAKEIGLHTVTLTFRGNYSGKVTRKFQIVPRKVTGLDFSAAQDKITLTWKPVSGATGYKVYLFNEQTKRYTALKATKQTRYTMQKLLPGTVYVLCVRAYAKQSDGTFKGALSKAKVTATKPLAPAVAATVKNGKATLRWESCGSCVYEIYAAEKKNGKYRLLGTTKKTAFVTQAFPRGSTQCFKVKALVRRKTTVLSGRNSEILSLRF